MVPQEKPSYPTGDIMMDHVVEVVKEDHEAPYLMKNLLKPFVGHLGRPGLTLYTLHQQKTHCVGPFGNNLRAGCSLTRNSNGVPQNQVFACREGYYCTLAFLNNY